MSANNSINEGRVQPDDEIDMMTDVVVKIRVGPVGTLLQAENRIVRLLDKVLVSGSFEVVSVRPAGR